MLEALKKIDKKLLIFTGCIVLLPVVIIIFMAIMQGCSNLKITPEEYENKMINAAEKYFEDNDKLPKEERATATVKLSKLIEKEYIKDTKKLLDDDTCKGEVVARLNGSTIEENNGGFINYTVKLECKNYKTETLKGLLMNDLTTTESGLYKQGNDYIFKGEDVDNYISFYGQDYRIVSVDENGYVKLLKSLSEASNYAWDSKFNLEVNNSYGKNIYKDSEILKQLINDYNSTRKISSTAKKHIVSYDVCSDARNIDDYSITYDNNCTNVLKNQVISLLDVEDFAKASLDPDCVDLSSKTCRNYNYLKDLNLNTWTVVPVANNSYEVYYITTSSVKRQEANRYNAYNIVIYIDGNEKINSGSGTKENPYIIK